MNYAIIAYPLSSSFQNKLESIAPSINYLFLSELRKLPLLKLIFFLRNLNANYLLLPFEDTNSLPLLPILTTIAAFAKAKSIEIVYPDFQRKKTTIHKTLRSLIELIFTSFISHVVLLHSRKQMKKLFRTNQSAVSPNKNINNILYLNTNLWFGVKAGGSVGHIAGVINALTKKGLKINYAFVGEKTLIDSQVTLTHLQPPKKFGVPAELNFYMFNRNVIKQLKNKFLHIPLKFIYQRLSLANFSGVVLAHYLNIPLILEYNGSEAWVAKNWGRQLHYYNEAVMAENVCLKHAYLIVTVSQVLKEELIQRGINPEKIIYYPNCIDPQIFNPDNFATEFCNKLRKQHHIPEDSILLTFVGTFGVWHGVDVLAKAIRLLIDTDEDWVIKNKVRFMLVGYGVKMSDVQSILNHDKYKPYVTFTGLIPQHETPGYLAISDILLSPHIPNSDGSKFFGSPTKLFEYMAMGKAILASNLEQIGDVLKNSFHIQNISESKIAEEEISKLAVLCEPGNIEELMAGIKFLVENPKIRVKLGLNARQEALAKYTWEKHVNAFLEKIL